MLDKLDPSCLKIWAEGEMGGRAIRCGDDKGLGIVGDALEAPVKKSSGRRIGRCCKEGQRDRNECNIITSSICLEHPMRCYLAWAQLLSDLGQEEDLEVRSIQIIVKYHRLGQI